MDKNRILGIILIVVSLIIAIAIIKTQFTKKNEEVTIANVTDIITETVTQNNNTITETTQLESTVIETESIEHEAHGDFETMEVKLPDEEVLNLIDGDEEGLKNEIQVFVNGYGLGDAEYADYAGDVQINSYDDTVTLTYYLKYRHKSARYFYLTYNKKTKEWLSRPAG